MRELAASQPDAAKLLSITPDSRLCFHDDISGKACSKLETRTMLSSRYNVFSF